MYKIKILEKAEFDNLEKAYMDNYPWGGDYRPTSYAQICVVENEGLYIKMTCFEKNPTATLKETYDMVCDDSAMEFFFGFEPMGKYINLETNALGTRMVEFGDGRYGRVRLGEICPLPTVTTEINEDSWSATYFVSNDVINAVYDGRYAFAEGVSLFGNIYKVGVKTPKEHYATWSNIDFDHPDFHRPECFGEFVIEK